MKKSKSLIIILVAIILVVIAYLQIFPLENGENNEGVMNTLREVVIEYCDELENQKGPPASPSSCPTCYWATQDKESYHELGKPYVRSNLSRTVSYEKTKIEGGYELHVSIPTLFGVNTRTSSSGFNVTIDNSGNVIKKYDSLEKCQ